MAYCTLTDLLKAVARETLEQLAVDNQNEQLEDATPVAAIDEAIAKGDDRVNTALAPFYDVPVILDPIPDSIRRLSTEAAIWELVKRRRATLTEEDKGLWAGIEDELELIRQGKQVVPGLTRTKGLPYSTSSEVNAPARPFSVNLTTGTDPLQGF